MASHHEPLSALGPVEWDDVPQDDLKTFLDDVFAESHTIIESIPPLAQTGTAKPPPAGRARAQTDGAVALDADMQRALALLKGHEAVEQAQQLRKEWKEAKVNARDNPLDISVHKLSAKDGKGAWFARRSVHEGLEFDRWKAGLEREFRETMKVQGSPGSGNIRGIGAERVVEHHTVPDAGQAEVYQLSAQFPGPTTPRDFITLLLTAETSYKLAGEPRPLRQYVIVSKPCAHPDCPPRQGIIRGRYESVEIIREVPSEAPATKRSWSSADLVGDEAKRASSSKVSSAGLDGTGNASEPAEEANPPSIEWLMVTRSDPGGSVPRFMIEKGTPPGIVGDAGKFIKWVTSHSEEEMASTGKEDGPLNDSTETGDTKESTPDGQRGLTNKLPNNTEQQDDGDEGFPSSTGLYGMITGAFGAASSVVATGLKRFENSPDSNDSSMYETQPTQQDEDTSDSEVSSIHSFASALEKSITEDKGQESVNGSRSSDSKSQGTTPQEKEFRKLQERKRKLDEKLAKMQERTQSRRQGDEEKESASLARLREKHEKELAKQDAKYQRELRKLDEKREQEERKAEERRRKTAEREEKANLSLELERTRAERDVALKKVQLLEGQVGELQGQNTKLVARLGKVGALDSAAMKELGLENGHDKAAPAVSS